jgi:hypothetical protein
LESSFDLFQKLERLDDFLVCVLARLEIAESRSGPVARVSETVVAGECSHGVLTRLAGSEAVLHGFFVAEGLLVVTKGGV